MSSFIFIYDVRFTNDEYSFLKTNRKSQFVIRTFFDNPSLKTNSN